MAGVDMTETLRRGRAPGMAARVERFLLVGTMGLGVNVAGLSLLHGAWDLPLWAASLAAIGLSMAVTFLLNEAWTWRDRVPSLSLPARGAFYFLINSAGMFVNWQVLLFLCGHQGLHYQAANLVGAAMAAVWNFALNNVLTWRA